MREELAFHNFLPQPHPARRISDSDELKILGWPRARTRLEPSPHATTNLHYKTTKTKRRKARRATEGNRLWLPHQNPISKPEYNYQTESIFSCVKKWLWANKSQETLFLLFKNCPGLKQMIHGVYIHTWCLQILLNDWQMVWWGGILSKWNWILTMATKHGVEKWQHTHNANKTWSLLIWEVCWTHTTLP
jgi:hypothetical protein